MNCYKNDFYIERANNSIWIGFFHTLRQVGLKHCFSTRLGGVSKGELEGLNISFCVNDEKENVQKNRQLLGETLNINYKKIVTAKQTHGLNIAIVGKQDIGKGALGHENAIENTDALLTTEKKVPLLMGFADCVPVIIYVPTHNLVAVVHAGWRGTLGKISSKVVSFICENYYVNAKDIVVGIGPSIGKCCYEVSSDLIKQFSVNFAEKESIYFENNEKRKIDLSYYNILQLMSVGVLRKNIFNSEVCTNCNSRIFYSHRASGGKAGRMGLLAVL